MNILELRRNSNTNISFGNFYKRYRKYGLTDKLFEPNQGHGGARRGAGRIGDNSIKSQWLKAKEKGYTKSYSVYLRNYYKND